MFFDGVLALSLVILAWRALASTDLYKAVVLFVSFGLLLALAWVRLEAPDIALAEAAIGAGLTGALLLDAVGHLQGRRRPVDAVQSLRVVIPVLAFGLTVLLVWAIADLPATSSRVPALVAAHLQEGGVAHEVTAVLLNFRGYDTLLEVSVLLIAVLGVLAMQSADAAGGAPPPASEVLRAFTNFLVPLMVLIAGYLLWAGAHHAGGAFQAGAVLAAAGVLLRLAGRLPLMLPPSFRLRSGVLAGFAVFLVIAVGVTVDGHALLEYPAGQAGWLILLIEATLTVSIGLILLLLFVGAPGSAGTTDNGGKQE